MNAYGSGLVYIGLGSNVGNRRRHLARAVAALRARWRVARSSPVYESAPIGPDQRAFLNMVVAVRPDCAPREMLRELKAMERRLGRRPTLRWGPREIDMDILLWGRAVISQKELVIPHPEMMNRLFVLEPLAAIAPRRVHPLAHRTITRLRNDLRDTAPHQKVELL